MLKTPVFSLLLLTMSLLPTNPATAQCPPLSSLTESLGQSLAGFDIVMSKNGYEVKQVIELGKGVVVYDFVPTDGNESYIIKITTNEKGEARRATLRSAYHDCWETFLVLAKSDPKKYVYKLGANKEQKRLGMYFVSDQYSVHGGYETTRDGRVEVKLMVNKIN